MAGPKFLGMAKPDIGMGEHVPGHSLHVLITTTLITFD